MNIFYHDIKRTFDNAKASSMFYTPYQNNYTLVFINKSIDYESYKNNIALNLGSLNTAVKELHAYLSESINTHQVKSKEDSEAIKKINLFLCNWDTELKKGNSFTSYENLKLILHGFYSLNIPVVDHIKNEKGHICNELINLPFSYKSFLRVDVYCPKNDTIQFFNVIMEYLSKHPAILKTIEKIEIAKPDFENSFVGKFVNNKPFPMIIIYPNKSITMVNDDKLVEIKKMLTNLILTKNVPINFDYCKQFTDISTITQGYRNYKNILKSLNIINQVYDENSNYSFIY